jgi:hypothetical protein
MIRKHARPQPVVPGSGAGSASPSGGAGAGRRPAGGGGGTGGGGGGTGGCSEKQTDTVRTMQGIMAKLRDELQLKAKAEAAKEKIKKADGSYQEGLDTAEKISEIARTFGSTSAGGTTGTQDGIWGGNTKKSLQAIKDFIQKAGISGVIISVGEGSSPYREMKDEDVIKAAQDNITNLARLFVAVGLDTPPEAAQQGGSGYVLDQVADSLHDLMIGQNPWPDYWGSRPVTIGDLRDLLTFFYLIQGLKYTDCQPLEERAAPARRRGREEDDRGGRARGAATDQSELEKFAQEILQNTLFSFAVPESGEAVPGAPAAAEATPAAEAEGDDEAEDAPRSGGEGPMEGGGDGHCFATIGHFIWWFSQRARAVYAQMMNLIRIKTTKHPIYKDRYVEDIDVQAAQAYMAAMRNIAMQWAQMMSRVEDILRKRGWTGRDGAQNPVVTLQILLEAMQGGGGAGRGPGGGGPGGGGSGSPGYTIPGDDPQSRALNGPIQNYMPLENLLNSDFFYAQSQSDLASLTRGGLPNIDIRTWRTGSWTDIATRYVEAPTQTEQLRMFPQWAGLVRKVIQEMFTNWQRDYEGQYDVETVLRRQDRMLSTWEQYIRAKISQAQRMMDREVARVGSREPEAREPDVGSERERWTPPTRSEPAQPQYADSRAGRQAQRTDERASGVDQRTQARGKLEEARARQRAQRRE